MVLSAPFAAAKLLVGSGQALHSQSSMLQLEGQLKPEASSSLQQAQNLVVDAEVSHRCRELFHQHMKLIHSTKGKGITCNLLMFRSPRKMLEDAGIKSRLLEDSHTSNGQGSHIPKRERLRR